VAAYRFLTTWLVGASRKSAWDVLQDAERWPLWRRGVQRVALLDPGDAESVGSRYRIA